MPPKTPKKKAVAKKQPTDERDAFLDELAEATGAPAVEEPEDVVEDEDDEEEEDGEVEELHQPAVSRKVPITFEPRGKSTPYVNPETILEEVFEEQKPKKSGKAMASQSFDRPKRAFPWVWVVSGVVVIAAVAAAGFWYFTQGPKFSDTAVKVVMTAPSNVSSGQTISLQVTYTNSSSVDLNKLELSVEYPEGFSYASSTVAANNDAKNQFSLGTVRAGQVGQMTITGQLLGSVDASLNFHGTLAYQPANFSSTFTASGDFAVVIGSSVIDVTVEGPKQLVTAATGQWTITYTNTSDTAIQGLRLNVTAPTGFTFVASTPKPTDTLTWDIATLESQAKGTIIFSGTISGQAGDSAEFTITTGIKKPGNIFETQSTIPLLVSMVSAGLKVNLAVNGISDLPVIAPGELATVTLGVANKSDADLQDVTVALTVGGVGDLAKAENSWGATVKNGVITWDKKTLPALALIQSGDTVTISLAVPTNTPTAVQKDADRNPGLTLSAVITTPSLPTDVTKTPATLTAKVSTTTNVSADARFYDDGNIQVGSGPIPPKVGQTTAYRVILSATTTTSDVQDLTVTTTLPSSVFWTGKHIGADAGTVTFDATTRTVTWKITKLPAGTGSRFPIVKATFEVSITPTSDQVGSVAVLTNAGSVSGTDSWTTKTINDTVGSLTSDVPNDPQAAGEGKIIP